MLKKHSRLILIIVSLPLILIILITIFLYIKAPIFFKPSNKVIQYQEEVKLSNGEMIWVDIKRHYWLSGGALGDPGSFQGNYMPGVVEISWDTGFEGVGRKKLSFINDIYLLDKIDGRWYVIGDTYGRVFDFDKSELHNCVTSGTYTPRIHISPICLVIINDQDVFEKPTKDAVKNVVFNILYADGMGGKNINSESLNEKKLSWQEKIFIQENFPKFIQYVGKTYQAYYDPKEY
ncbi:MAG: hypothetical protein Q4G18_13350 [Myroides sp.]|nr:hypothetical protein [Myroides sp.]